MDLRSIKPGLAAVSHPLFSIHPKTGEMVTPLGYGKDGNPWWPVMGGAPDDDDDSGESDDEDSEDDDSEEDEPNEEEDSDDSDDDAPKKKGDKDAKIKALEEEKQRHYNKAKKEKDRADKLEAELKALRDKSLKPEEREERDKIEQSKKEKEAADRVAKLNLENAFLRANEIEWVKPEQALAILLADDDYEVEFDDDGKVDRKSLRAELKRLAKANPHLVKPKAGPKDEGDDDADEDGSAPRATASKMNGTRKGKRSTGKSREELAKKFPALNRVI